MRVAVLSDIHGNAVALEAALSDLERYPADQLICLGDAIQGGPQPARVVAELGRLACPVVMGNADAWLLTGRETGNHRVTPEQEAMRQWSLEKLSPADRQFIGEFLPTVSVPLPGAKRLLGFHGSPVSFDQILLPDTPKEEFLRVYGPYAPAILSGGHTHRQFIRELDGPFFFNPGSVGAVYDVEQEGPAAEIRHFPWAEYAVLEVTEERIALEFRRVPYPVEAMIESARSSGCPTVELYTRQYGWSA